MSFYVIVGSLAITADQAYQVYKTLQDLREEANSVYADYYPNTDPNSYPPGQVPDRDAFRHAYSSAMLVAYLKENGYTSTEAKLIAQLAGHANEGLNPGNTEPEANKDHFNNKEGRNIGDSAPSMFDIPDMVKDALDNGDLAKNVEDPRIGDDPDPLFPMTPGTDQAPADSCPVPNALSGFPALLGMLGQIITPLVIDMDGDGIELTNATTQPVYWDIDNDGFAEASAWVKGDDALLAIDLNNNGSIDNHSELFGNSTTNGFAKLSELDSNQDGIINSSDTKFSDLKIWRDINQDGISQAGELQTLSQAGIASINLNANYVNYQVAGNDVIMSSTVTMSDSSTKTIVDALFKFENMNSTYKGDFELDFRALFLPSLRGYGNIKDLTVEMSFNENLLFKAAELADFRLEDILDPANRFDEKFKDFLFEWGGQSYDNKQVLWASTIYDARKLQFAQELGGVVFDPTGYMGPGRAAQFREDALWEKAQTYYQSNFLAQTVCKELFTGTVTYDSNLGLVQGVTGLSSTALSNINSLISSSTDKAYSWSIIVSVVEGVIGVANLSSGDYTALDNAIQSSATGWTLDTMVDYVVGNPSEVYGTSGADTMNGTFGNDILGGSSGNDTLNGGFGDDVLYGNYDNDIYIGGAGNDIYNEAYGSGDDTYYYDSGNDIILNDVYGNDKIVLRAGITIDDLSIERLPMYGVGTGTVWDSGHLKISISDLGSIYLYNQYSSGGYFANGVETVQFADLSTLNLATLDGIVYGTSGNDTMTGADRSYYLNDRIDAGSGNDTINGGLGHNYLVGGMGNDTYIYGGGVDYIVDYDGNDQIIFDSNYDQAKFEFKFNPMTDSYWGDTTNLSIYYDGKLVAVIDKQLYAGGWYAVEKVVIDGVHEFNLATDIDWTQNGTSSGETIFALQAPQIANPVVNGMGGNDYLYGSDKNDTINGGTGDDYLDGRYGNDILRGEAGTDTLYGGYGNDTLYGGDGADTLNGGYGADTFVFEAASAFNNVDTVMDFNAGQGDVLKISDLLIGYTPGTSDINDFVSFTVSGSNTNLVIDRDGTGTTYNDQSIATLSNVTGLVVDDLFNNNQIIV